MTDSWCDRLQGVLRLSVDFCPLDFGKDGSEGVTFGEVLQSMAGWSFSSVRLKIFPDELDEAFQKCRPLLPIVGEPANNLVWI